MSLSASLPQLPGPRRRTTLADVAKHCGVSKAAVSLALNRGSKGSTLRDDTCQRILRAVHELSYRPSWTAKSLAERKSRQVGLLFRFSIPEFRGVFEDLLRQLTVTLEQAGYHLLFVPIHGDNWRDMLQDQRLDACALADPLIQGMDELLMSIALPSVLLNNTGPAGVSQVIPDDVRGAQLAVEHLVTLGHRKIAYLRMGSASVGAHHSVASRVQGYHQAMREAGLLEHALDADEPLAQFLDRLKVGPGGYTGLVLYSHTEAIRLLPLLHARGIRVPQDLSLVSFNDIFPMADLVPAFTTIDVSGGEIGRIGAGVLLEQLNGGDTRPQRILLPERLVARASTAPPPRSA